MMRVVFSTILFLCVSLDIAVCNSEVNDDSSARTTLQLRDSVEFSYSISNSFLDLIRGQKPPTAVFETFVNIQSAFLSTFNSL